MAIYNMATHHQHRKGWCCGELSRKEAEEKLRTCGGSSSCFLVRESRESLVLSVMHSGDFHHTVIKYGPGWYKLQGSEASFRELNELISHYQKNHITYGNKEVTLGTSYKKDVPFSNTTVTTSPHLKGVLADHGWYQEDITEEEAELLLRRNNCNCFLVRHSADNLLILSKKTAGLISHLIITESPEGYCLEGKKQLFKNMPEMIQYYQEHPLNEQGTQVLGIPCDTKPAGMYNNVHFFFN